MDARVERDQNGGFIRAAHPGVEASALWARIDRGNGPSGRAWQNRRAARCV